MFRLLLTVFLLFMALPACAQNAVPSYGIAMHGALKYGPGFTHFDYVNPDAPKGGTLRLAGLGETYDSFNPYIAKGVTEENIGLIYAPLMEQSADEPFSEYGAIVQSVEIPKDRSSVTYILRPQARWDDGQPITADDVKWSFDTLMKKGSPTYRIYYADVAKVDILGPLKIKFTFKGANNPEMPLIMGQLPVLPKHYWTQKGHDITKTTLTPPLGSGQYRIASFDAGRSVTYERVKNWWGENLPVYKGRYNFDKIVVKYFRDPQVALEAFFAGAYDFRWEMSAKQWASAYNAPAVKDGRIIKRVVKNGLPQGMQAFVFNIRRPVFKDQAVRKAIDYAFDFESLNKRFAFGAYSRTTSYFENSPMAAPNHPPTGKVKDILMQFKSQLPPAIFTTRYEPPHSDGSGTDRDNLRTAIKTLDDAGYKMGPDGIRIDPKTGKKLEFEFLTNGANSMFDRWVMPFIDNLKKIGIKATFRAVDASQYVNRIINFDYDMIVTTFAQSLSPGNEQREYWGSAQADMKASHNFIGLKSPVVDKLVSMIVSAPTEDDLIARCQALDYVLLDGNYVIPNWNLPAWRLAYWNKFGLPEHQAPYAIGNVDTWWSKSAQ